MSKKRSFERWLVTALAALLMMGALFLLLRKLSGST